MRRQSAESSKEPKGILKTSTKYGIPTSPSSQNLSRQGQSKYESILKQHGDSILKKEIEQKSLQQKQITNENKSNNSFHNKSNASINSARKNNSSKLDNSTTVKRQSISQQQLGQLNQSVDKQRRQSRLNDQILEISQGSRLATYSQSPLNINQSHIINNSIHAYVNNQNQLSQSPNQYQTSLATQAGNVGGINSAAATLNSIFNQVTLKDLCPEDKRKVGQLMKKLAEEKQEKELLKQKLQINENVYKERINHIIKENQQIQENTNVLKEKFQQSVKLLQNVRDRSAERGSPYLFPQQITPQSNNQFNYDSNQSSQPQSQNFKKQLNKSLQQISDNNIGEQEQLQNTTGQNQNNKSNLDLRVSSFNNIPVKDLPEDYQQQMRQSRQSDFQMGSSSEGNQGYRQEDIEENDDRLSRHSRLSKQGEIQNYQGMQQVQQQNIQPFASKQSTINANMYQRNNNNNNSLSSKNINQFQQAAYLADSLDQEVQEFLSQSINNAQTGKIADLEQQLNQVSNIPQQSRNNQTPNSYHQSTAGQIKYSIPNQQQQIFQNQQLPLNPNNQYQDQAAQTSFAKYVYKNGQVNDQQYIPNNQLLKNNSQLKYSLSLQSKSPQTTLTKQPHLTNVYQSASFMQSNGTINQASINNHTEKQKERITLKVNSGESEKMFNQWKKQYAATSTNEQIINSPYKNQHFYDRAKQVEEDDTSTFQEIQNLRSQMQGLVNSLKQISLNKQQKQEQTKQIQQNSNKKINSKESQSSEHQPVQKLLQGEIHSVSSRGNYESLNSNKQTENPKNTVKSTMNSYKENRNRNSNTSHETFAQIPQHTQNHSSNRSSQKQDTIQTNPPPKYLKQYKNSSEENSSEDDDQIEIAQKFLNLKKQKLLSHLQDIRKDDFLDSSSFEQSQLFDKKKNHSQEQKHYDLPLQILQSETTSNANISTSYHNEKMSKFQNKYIQSVNNKDQKNIYSSAQQGERNYISPPSHQQNLGNYPNNIQISTSRKSSPQLHLRAEVGNIDSNRHTSNPETLTRVTSRNIASNNKNNGATFNSGGDLNANMPLNLENMSKEEIKKLNRMLERKLREMSESVSYEISSQNNEFDVSEQIHTNQIIAHNHINTPLRQSQNTNTFELSNTQIQIQSLQESQLLKYSNVTGQGQIAKTKGSQGNQQKSSTQINNYYNPQNHNIHNISGVGSNNQASQRSTHKNIQQSRENTNPTLNDEYVTFRHEDQERGDTKRTVDIKDKRKQNNLFANNGLDESKRINAVRVTENFSYLSTPQPEKLQVDLASTAKKEILQGNLQILSSDEKFHRQGEDSKYIRVEDGKKENQYNQGSAKQLILQKIQHLTEEEMLSVLQALKEKKINKNSSKNLHNDDNESQDEYEQIKIHQSDKSKQNARGKASSHREEADEDNNVDEENEQSSYMSVQQQQEDIYQDNYEDIYNDISREQRFQPQDNESRNLKRPLEQKKSKQNEEESKYHSQKVQKIKSDNLNEDELEINQLIQQSDHQQHQSPLQKYSNSNTPQNYKDQQQNRLIKDNKASQKSIKSGIIRQDQEEEQEEEEDQPYDEGLFQNVQTIEKQELSKRTFSAKSQKEMQIPHEEKKKNQFIESKLDNINQQGFHISKQYQKGSTQNLEKKKQREQLYQTEGMFEGDEELPQREVQNNKRKGEDKYYSSSYTETDQSIKYIKKKIENQI